MTKNSNMVGVALHVFAVVSAAISLCGAAKADWINLTGAEVAPNVAEIYVEDTGVRVALEIYVSDVKVFFDLIPADWLKEKVVNLEPDAERLERFSRQGLSILGENGEPLDVSLKTIEPRMRVDRSSPVAGTIDPYTGRRNPSPPEDKRVVYAEIFYAYGGERPDKITLRAPQTGDQTPTPSIGMIVFHRDVPVIDFRYLSDKATLTLNWDDPWFSEFDQPALRRHHRYPRMSFLYAEPYEIRHEVLIRVRDAAELVGLKPPGDELTKEESEYLSKAAALFISEQSPLTIDDKPVTPEFDRVAYMRIGLRGLEILPPDTKINVDAAILGLIWSAPTDGFPKTASVTWTLFDEKGSRVPGYAIDAAGPFLAPLTPDDPVLTWTNHFKKPPVPPVSYVAAENWSSIPLPGTSIVAWIAAAGLVAFAFVGTGRNRKLMPLVGAVALTAAGVVLIPYGQVSVPRPGVLPAELKDEEARALTSQLLSNVYRSFDFKAEDQVFDRLAKTLDGALLEKVYLDQRRTLRVAKAGGAEARVKTIKVDTAKPEHVKGTAADFKIRTQWTIVGSVGHWGHIHQRVNTYEADLLISPRDGNWKIMGFDVHTQERVS